MIEVSPLDQVLLDYLKKHNLIKKWNKSNYLLHEDIHHPGLNVEILEPKHRKIYSFRLDKKYRGIFIYNNQNTIEIIVFTNHYE
jgi:plasmid maintenance system killer protein